MQCIIMKTKAILLFLINYITISLSTDKGEKKIVSEKLKLLNKNCSNLLKIEDNRIEEYATNCKTSTEKDFKINEENILKNTCQVIEYIIDLICKSHYFQQASKNLNINLNKTIMCPFNFSQLPLPNNLQFVTIKNIIDLLSNETICQQTCYDLYQPKDQCIILHQNLEYWKIIETHKKNDFFKNQNQTQSNTNFTKALDTEKKEKLPLVANLFEEEKKGNKDFKYPNYNLNELREAEAETNKKYVTKPSKLAQHLNNFEYLKPQNVENSHSNLNISVTRKPMEKKTEITSKVLHQNSEFSEFPERSSLEVSQSTEKINHIEVEKQIFLSSEAPYQNFMNANQLYSRERLLQTEESHFFFYFLMLFIFVIIGYFAFHNKKKILAYALEGKNNRRHRRRSNSTKYKRLESNLEDIIVSDLPHTTSTIVY